MSKTHRTQRRAEDCRSKRRSLLITEEGKGHLTVHGRGDYQTLVFALILTAVIAQRVPFSHIVIWIWRLQELKNTWNSLQHYQFCLRSAQVHTLITSFSPLFQIYRGGELQNFIDGYNIHKSNWMRYVNPARSMAEQNLVACQNNGEIYFYTIRPVEPNQELLVWYSQEFAQRLCSQQSNTKPSECSWYAHIWVPHTCCTC